MPLIFQYFMFGSFLAGNSASHAISEAYMKITIIETGWATTSKGVGNKLITLSMIDDDFFVGTKVGLVSAPGK